MTTATKEPRLTGWHVLAIFVGAFTVIVGVNITLAVNAVRSFPGLEVKNSYVASQSFDARRAAQEALGWTAEASLVEDRLKLAFTDAQGQPVQVGHLTTVLGRRTHVQDDLTPEFTFDGTAYLAPVTLAPGNWLLRVDAQSLDGTAFQQRLALHVTR